MPEISQLPALLLAPNANDVLPIVDVTDLTEAPTGTTKKVKVSLIGSSVAPINILYADLVIAIGGSTLQAGAWYRIADYATVHYIVDGNGTRYNDVITGANEPLIVLATSTNTISAEAYSPSFPQDIIHYDWNPANWLDDLSFADAEATHTIIAGFKGVITFRHDTLLDNSFGYDFRQCKFRRWKTNAPAWDNLTGYSAGEFVTYSGFIYKELQPSYQTQEDDVTLAGTGGTANISGAGGLTRLVTFNSDLTTTASDFVASWAADYLAQNIVVTNSGGIIVFISTTVGTPFTQPVVTNVSGNLNGSISYYVPDTAAQTPAYGSSYWVQLLDLSITEYWNAAPVRWPPYGSIPSGVLYADFLTFNETGAGTYLTGTRNNHFAPFKDNYTNLWSTGSLLPNNVFFIRDTPYFTLMENEAAADFSRNTIGGGDFDGNIIGADCYANVGLGNFHSNTVDNYFINNIVAGDPVHDGFSYNVVGHLFLDNIIGSNCHNNNMGSGISHSVLGINSVGNVLGDLFGNRAGNGCSYNRFGSHVVGNVMADGFQLNAVANGFNSVDFSLATLVYAGFGVELYTRPDGTPRLRYYDDTDSLVVVAVSNSSAASADPICCARSACPWTGGRLRGPPPSSATE